MSTLERVIGNSSIMLVSQAITWTATLVLTAALGRSLGDAGFGQLYLAMSFGVIFSVLVEFGLDQQLVRAAARDRSLASSYLVNSMAIKAVFAAISYLLILVIVELLEYPGELKTTIAVYSLILLFNGLSGSLTAVYQSAERVFHPAVATVIEKTFVAIVCLMLLHEGYGITTMAAVFVVGSALSVVWKALFLRRIVRISLTLDRLAIRTLIVGALPFFLYWALGAVYYRIDVVLLSKLADDTAVGWYAAAYRLFDTLVFLPSMVSTVIMFPILSRLATGARSDLRLAVGKGLNTLLMLGVPICTGLFVLADPIVDLIYGKPAFANTVPVLHFLTVGLFFLYLNSALGVALVSLNQERKMTVIAALATTVNIGLNWTLIPQFQHLAAASVTVVTELFIFCCLVICIPKDLLQRSSATVFLKAGVASMLMAVVLQLLAGQSLVILVPAGGATYCAAALILRLVPGDDVSAFKRVLQARRRSRPVPVAS